MEVTGHRGQVVAGGPPENTLEAVIAALDGGAAGVELDVRLTVDGVPVCIHDPDLRRLTGNPALVSQLRYDELSHERLTGGVRIARLDEVAHLVRGRGALVAEVKHDPYASMPPAAPVLQALCAAEPWPDLVVSSFSTAFLADVRREHSEARRALVTGPRIPAAAGLQTVLAAGHHELHAHVKTVLADHETADHAVREGVPLRCWTVNREVDARLLDIAGVTGIITDDPARLGRSLAWPMRHQLAATPA